MEQCSSYREVNRAGICACVALSLLGCRPGESNKLPANPAHADNASVPAAHASIRLEEISAIQIPASTIVRGAVSSGNGEFVILVSASDTILIASNQQLRSLAVRGLSDPIAAHVISKDHSFEVIDKAGRLRVVSGTGMVFTDSACSPQFTVETAVRTSAGWYAAGSMPERTGPRRRLAVSRLSRAKGPCPRTLFAPVQTAAGAVSARMSTRHDTVELTGLQAPFSNYIIGDSGTILRAAARSGPPDSGGDASNNDRPRWILMPHVQLDSGWTIRAFSDLRSDKRSLHILDASGSERGNMQLSVPLGLLAADTIARIILASRRTDRNELVWYRWRWVIADAGR